MLLDINRAYHKSVCEYQSLQNGFDTINHNIDDAVDNIPEQALDNYLNNILQKAIDEAARTHRTEAVANILINDLHQIIMDHIANWRQLCHSYANVNHKLHQQLMTKTDVLFKVLYPLVEDRIADILAKAAKTQINMTIDHTNHAKTLYYYSKSMYSVKPIFKINMNFKKED